MFHIWDASVIFEKILNRLQHENDGLIFTVKSAPYYPGTCEHIFEWKPMHLNTIDFNVIPLSPNGLTKSWYQHVWQLQTVDGEVFDFIAFTPEEDQLYRELSKKWQPLVLECFFDKQFSHPVLNILASYQGVAKKQVLQAILQGHISSDLTVSHGGWKVHRQRTDKAANAPKVAQNILAII